MKPPGRHFTTIWLLLCLLCPAPALAALSASIDRERVSLGDSLRLTLTADGDEELSDADLRPLLQDFEILQRSTSSNISIVNGRRSQTKQLLVDIAPKRAGRLRIPALSAGTARSNPLEVLVAAQAQTSTGGQPLVDETRRIVKAFSKGPHIFNLGHGITPDADPANVQLMIDTVRDGAAAPV